ncbi:RNase A-like domain-containing protein [Erwinia amylovora]
MSETWKHTGKTVKASVARLTSSLRLMQSSSFISVQDAEILISQVLRNNQNQNAILARNALQGQNLKMIFNGSFASKTGISVSRGTTEVKDCYQVRVVLKFEYWHGKPYFVLTFFRWYRDEKIEYVRAGQSDSHLFWSGLRSVW